MATNAATDSTHCTTCCRPVASPYRRYDERGKVVEGCVDASHAGHLRPGSESARWHHRPAAAGIRRGLARYAAR